MSDDKVILSLTYTKINPKNPPFGVESEQAIIAAILRDRPAAISAVAEILTADDFIMEEHRQVYKAALNLHKRGVQTDALAVREELEAIDPNNNPLALIPHLSDNYSSSANLMWYAENVLEVGRKRKLEQALIKYTRKLQSDKHDSAEILTDINLALSQIQLSNRSKSGVKIVSAEDIDPKPIHWMWRHWLAKGKLHLLAGAQATGKTTIGLKFAATISAGGAWPDGTKASQGKVVIWTGEDDVDDTLVPRLICCGANMANIKVVAGMSHPGGDGHFDPSIHMNDLRRAIDEMGGVDLFIIDSVVSVVRSNSNRTAETRRDLTPLVHLGQETGAGVLGITHFSKNTQGNDPVERVVGSLSFSALARIVLATAKVHNDDDKTDTRILTRAKSNIGPDEGGFDYDIELTDVSGFPELDKNARIAWGNQLEGTARDLLADADDSADPEKRSSLNDAKEFLVDQLSSGPKRQSSIRSEAERNGHRWGTLRRAKKELGIESQKEQFGGKWRWALPEKT